MKNYKNEGVLDRVVRLIAFTTFIILAYFWLSGVLQIIFYVLGAISLFTAITGFCALYKIFGINTLPAVGKKESLVKKNLLIILLLIVAIGGVYFSAFFTKKIFLDDYSRMNNYYKQTLFFTGQENRDESILNYDKLVSEYNVFQSKYNSYHPYVIKSDKAFNSDLKKVSDIINSLKEPVLSGDLKLAHLSFEAIRPIFQDILKRNNFSMLAIALVDFHDAMEKIIEAADSKDATQLLLVYPEVDLKLKEIESIVNDEEIKTIRTKLEEVVSMARLSDVDSLSVKAAELKSSFVKVYLKRG